MRPTASIALRLAAAHVAAAVCVLAPAWAHGHGREPEVIAIGTAEQPETVIALSSLGLWRSDDDGETWDFVCFDAYETDERDNPSLVVRPDGEAVLGNFAGLWRTSSATCDWSQPTSALTDSIVPAVVSQPGSPEVLVAVRSTGTLMPEEIWRSADGGDTWTSVFSGFEGALVRHVAIAADGRLYASGHRPLTADNTIARGALFASTDDGASWTTLDVPYLEGEQGLRILAVDPGDSSRVWVATELEDGDIAHEERLLLSADGGASVAEVRSFTRADAMVVDPASGRLWLGGERKTGLWTDAGDGTWTQLQSGFDVSALHRRETDGSLWLGGKPLREDFAVARSDNGGVDVRPVFVRDDIARRDRCAVSTTVAGVCGDDAWFDLVSDLDLDPSVARPPMSMEPADAGSDVSEPLPADVAVGTDVDGDTGLADEDAVGPIEPTDGDSGGCGCRVADTPGPPHGGLAVGGMLLCCLAIRRRWGIRRRSGRGRSRRRARWTWRAGSRRGWREPPGRRPFGH